MYAWIVKITNSVALKVSMLKYNLKKAKFKELMYKRLKKFQFKTF
jgi:hypothetical protein